MSVALAEGECSGCVEAKAYLERVRAPGLVVRCDECGAPLGYGEGGGRRAKRQRERDAEREDRGRLTHLLADAALLARWRPMWAARGVSVPTGALEGLAPAGELTARPTASLEHRGGTRIEAIDRPDYVSDSHRSLARALVLESRLEGLRLRARAEANAALVRTVAVIEWLVERGGQDCGSDTLGIEYHCGVAHVSAKTRESWRARGELRACAKTHGRGLLAEAALVWAEARR